MHDRRADRETLRRFVDDAPVALAMLDAATYRGRRHYDLFKAS